MTAAHVEKFVEIVGNDSALLARIGVYNADADADTAAASALSVCANAVKEAKALGLEITEEEFMGYLNSINSVLAGGELVDEQLDAVAGGGLFGTVKKKELSIIYGTVDALS
jgi:hypothetical protein